MRLFKRKGLTSVVFCSKKTDAPGELLYFILGSIVFGLAFAPKILASIYILLHVKLRSGTNDFCASG